MHTSNDFDTTDPDSARTTGRMHPSRALARFFLPVMLLAFACNGDQPGDGDGETSGDGDGDPGDGDGDPGDGDGDPGDGDPGEPTQLRSDEPHDENPLLGPGEAQILAAANQALTLELYHALRNGDGAGVGFSISAHSIVSAFGMLYAGSVDPARGEIAQTLHYDLEGEQQHVAHNWLDAQLESRNIPASEPGDGDGDEDAVELQTANGLWMLDDYADGVSPDFLDLLSIHYDAGMTLAAFDQQPDAERESINEWVSEQTGGLIPSLFAPDSLTEFTTLVLVNALYLRAPWSEPFSEGYTQQRDFTRLDNQVVSVDMMRGPYLTSALHVANSEYQAAALPLRGEDLDIVVILPEDFGAFEDSLDQAKLAEVLGALSYTPLDLSVPKFNLEAAFELSSELQDLGMVAPFTDLASFDAIHPEIDVIEVVVHNTVIKIDEDGVEAAAATGIGGDGDGDGDPPQPMVMVVDRPFLLAIRDRPTNTLLFFGRVLEPSL
jgi:serpin B